MTCNDLQADLTLMAAGALGDPGKPWCASMCAFAEGAPRDCMITNLFAQPT